jgi:uncharacterized membrane protein YdbT with pleckstrin-like domain
MPQNEKVKSEEPNALFLRGSTFLLVFKVITIIVLATILQLFIRLPILFLDFNKETILQLYSFNTSLVLLLSVLEIISIVLTMLNWINEYYEIIPGKIIHRKGVFFTKQEIFACHHVESIELLQGFMGKLFNYGSLDLFSPTLEKKIFLYNINNPDKYTKSIERILDQDLDNTGKGSIFIKSS